MSAKGISLCIGINKIDETHYGVDGALDACEKDAIAIGKLTWDAGFSAYTLLTKKATRKNVLRGIKKAARNLKSGDIFFLYYSGHGGKVFDADGDEKSGDDTFCLYDAQLIDDELRVLWSEFKAGVRILVIADSCHSGTVVSHVVTSRDAEGNITKTVTNHRLSHVGNMKIKSLVGDPRYFAYDRNKAFYDNLLAGIGPKSKIKASVKLLAASDDKGYAEDALPGEDHSQFTGQLLKYWRSGRFKGNYSKLMAKIKKGLINKVGEYQKPGIKNIGRRNPTFSSEKPFTIESPVG